jgi:hypothetical protein
MFSGTQNYRLDFQKTLARKNESTFAAAHVKFKHQKVQKWRTTMILKYEKMDDQNCQSMKRKLTS